MFEQLSNRTLERAALGTGAFAVLGLLISVANGANVYGYHQDVVEYEAAADWAASANPPNLQVALDYENHADNARANRSAEVWDMAAVGSPAALLAIAAGSFLMARRREETDTPPPPTA